MTNFKACMITKVGLFLELAKPDKDGISGFICTDEFKNGYRDLKFGNGGSWCRRRSSLSNKYKTMTVKENGKVLYLWDATEVEINILNHQIKKLNFEKTTTPTKLKYIKLCGYQKNPDESRPISVKIRTRFKDKGCVVCGSNSDTIIDHKNGLYNNPRVLNIITQKISDFQVLCNHCNLQKRQTIKDMKKTGIRYPATKIGCLYQFNISYTSGDSTYDKYDPHWGVGTYWYDPPKFMKHLFKMLKK